MLLVSLLAYAAVVPDFQGHYERYNNDQLDTDTAFIDLTEVGSNTYEPNHWEIQSPLLSKSW